MFAPPHVTHPAQSARKDEGPQYVYIPYDVANAALILIVLAVCAWTAWTVHLCHLLYKREGS